MSKVIYDGTTFTTKKNGKEKEMSSITHLVTSLGLYGYVATLVLLLISPTVSLVLLNVGCLVLAAYFLVQVLYAYKEEQQYDMGLGPLYFLVIIIGPILGLMNVCLDIIEYIKNIKQK